MFLAPGSVSTGDYDTHYFSTTSSYTYTSNYIGGSLLGVRILPLLNSNPNATSGEGEYTASELSNINTSNYLDYFYRLPNVHYTADLESSGVVIDYRASGQYFVEIDAIDDQGIEFTRIFHDQVDDFFGEDPPSAGKDKASVSRVIKSPTADLLIVSDGDPNDNGFNKNAFNTLEDEGKNVEKANSLANAIEKIKEAYEANSSKKISVVLTGHGRDGSIKIGTERINSDADGVMTPEEFKDAIKKYVHTIEFFSCNVAKGKVGDDFLDIFSELGTASAYPTTVTSGGSSSWFGFVWNGFFDVNALGKKAVVTVPEPATLWLLLLGSIGFLYRISIHQKT